jgi:hypothetical protein
MAPHNHPLNSDPAGTVFRLFSFFRLLGYAKRIGAGGAGYGPYHPLAFRR